jgi:hypothetical protein
MQSQIVAYFQLHAVDFREEPRRRRAICERIRFHFAQVDHLVLEMSDALPGRFKLLVVGNHGFSAMISMMPREPPSRFACQYSTAALQAIFTILARWQRGYSAK